MKQEKLTLKTPEKIETKLKLSKNFVSALYSEVKRLKRLEFNTTKITKAILLLTYKFSK